MFRTFLFWCTLLFSIPATAQINLFSNGVEYLTRYGYSLHSIVECLEPCGNLPRARQLMADDIWGEPGMPFRLPYITLQHRLYGKEYATRIADSLCNLLGYKEKDRLLAKAWIAFQDHNETLTDSGFAQLQSMPGAALEAAFFGLYIRIAARHSIADPIPNDTPLIQELRQLLSGESTVSPYLRAYLAMGLCNLAKRKDLMTDRGEALVLCEDWKRERQAYVPWRVIEYLSHCSEPQCLEVIKSARAADPAKNGTVLLEQELARITNSGDDEITPRLERALSGWISGLPTIAQKEKARALIISHLHPDPMARLMSWHFKDQRFSPSFTSFLRPSVSKEELFRQLSTTISTVERSAKVKQIPPELLARTKDQKSVTAAALQEIFGTVLMAEYWTVLREEDRIFGGVLSLGQPEWPKMTEWMPYIDSLYKDPFHYRKVLESLSPDFSFRSAAHLDSVMVAYRALIATYPGVVSLRNDQVELCINTMRCGALPQKERTIARDFFDGLLLLYAIDPWLDNASSKNHTLYALEYETLKQKKPDLFPTLWDAYTVKYFWQALEPADKAQIEARLRQLDIERPDQYNLGKVKKWVAKARE